MALPTPGAGFHAVSFAPGLNQAWAVGNGGAVARLQVRRTASE
jgi:hypothetical protein